MACTKRGQGPYEKRPFDTHAEIERSMYVVEVLWNAVLCVFECLWALGVGVSYLISRTRK